MRRASSAAACLALSTSGAFISDLKIGYWLGATPRRQQRWKFLGIVVASLCVGLVIHVLVGRLESQLLRALDLAADRLQGAGRLGEDAQVNIAAAPALAGALRNPSQTPVILPEPQPEAPTAHGAVGESPRQLIGQPASPGLATGQARRVRDAEDLGRFRAGEVLVCDAIQPTMTHLVPLACAIIERRGGMLIHGAIIARELGIPCVNGIANAVDLLEAGQVVTVDGYLGIVAVGAPEFDLEKV